MKLLTIADVEAITGAPFAETHHQCHAISHAIVQSGFYPLARVARGTATGVGGQHSWVVVGDDCYAPRARIVDPTLWSYDDRVSGVWHGTAADGAHRPRGAGRIWDHGRPPEPTGPVIDLAVDPGRPARVFLEFAAPRGLDRHGWRLLADSPVGGWPAGDIIAAMADTPDLAALVPIDVLGMITDRNPGGVYLRTDPARVA
jgi:hypothetical protein